MSDSPDSWVVYGPKRSPRAKLLGSVLAIIQAKDRQIRARLHQISGSGGVLQITDALDEAAKVDLIFHLGSTTWRNQAEMLGAMWSTQGFLQPFRFLGLSEEHRSRLIHEIETLLAGKNQPRSTPSASSRADRLPFRPL